MPTRSALKKIARIQKQHGPNIDKSWEDFLDRHRSNKPSTRLIRRRHVLLIVRTLADAGMVIRPQEFTPDHTAFLKTFWHPKLAKKTIDDRLSTIRWIGRLLHKELVA